MKFLILVLLFKKGYKMLKNIAKLIYGHQVFVIDKFSGFDQVEFNINNLEGFDDLIITYSMKIYFSGQSLKLEKKAVIKKYIYDKKSWFKIKCTPEFEFYENTFKSGLHLTFEKSGYNSGESIDILPDIVRWFAKNTNTYDTLEELKKDIRFCLEFIDKYYKKYN